MFPAAATAAVVPGAGAAHLRPSACVLSAMSTCVSAPTGIRAATVLYPCRSPFVLTLTLPAADGGTAHVPFSSRNRVPPAVAPGSGTRPVACDAPEATNTAVVAHTGTPPATVSTCPADPMAVRVAAPAVPPTIRSPGVVIGLANPAGLAAHLMPSACVESAVSTCVSAPTGTRAAVVENPWRSPFVVTDTEMLAPHLIPSVWVESAMIVRPSAPTGRREGVPPPRAAIRSPFRVIGLAKPAALLAQPITPAVTVSTCPFPPTGTRIGAPTVPPLIRSSARVMGLITTEAGMSAAESRRNVGAIPLAAGSDASTRFLFWVVMVSAMVPPEVIGEPATVMNAGALTATDVTLPPVPVCAYQPFVPFGFSTAHCHCEVSTRVAAPLIVSAPAGVIVTALAPELMRTT